MDAQYTSGTVLQPLKGKGKGHHCPFPFHPPTGRNEDTTMSYWGHINEGTDTLGMAKQVTLWSTATVPTAGFT